MKQTTNSLATQLNFYLIWIPTYLFETIQLVSI